MQNWSGRGLVDIIARYAQTFLLLQRYDEGLLTEPKAQSGGKLPTLEVARAALDGLKVELMARGEASELFARDRGDGLASLLGNLDQSVFGEPAYPSVEAKAAHLLYFVVKNHPFSDGNKRSAAFLFVDFLHRNARLLNAAGEPVINDVGLAALTLLSGQPYSGEYGFIETTMLWPITHMVPPADQAVRCQSCHARQSRLAEIKDLYIPGRDRATGLDRTGWTLVLLVLAGVFLHALLRLIFSGRSSK